VSGSAFSARATTRLVAVGAVLSGLFFMHGLATQGCAGGAQASASSMVHPVTVATAMGGPDMATGVVVASASRPLAHSASGTDAGESGALCMSTPPPPGWAGLMVLLLGVSVVGLTNLVIAATFITGLVIWDLLGHLPLPLGVAGHEGSTVIVGLNGLRLLRNTAWHRATPNKASR
jgi:hypothetical protein